MIAHYVLTILAVADVGRAATFYETAFGWKRSVDVPVYVEFAVPGGLRLGVYRRDGYAKNHGATPAPVPPGAVSSTEIYLMVDDMAAAVDRLRRAGGRELSPLAKRDWGDEVAYFADPDGNVIALARPLAKEK